MGKDFITSDDLSVLIASINEPDCTWKSMKEFKPIGKIKKTTIDNDEKSHKITNSIICKLQKVGRNGRL